MRVQVKANGHICVKLTTASGIVTEIGRGMLSLIAILVTCMFGSRFGSGSRDGRFRFRRPASADFGKPSPVRSAGHPNTPMPPST